MRVSARNDLGYGARRTADPTGAGATAEGGVQVPYHVRDFLAQVEDKDALSAKAFAETYIDTKRYI